VTNEDPGPDESEVLPGRGSSAPSEHVRDELSGVLQLDASMLGEVFRRREGGESVAELRAVIGDFAWNYNRAIEALLSGDLPTAPAVIRGTQTTFRRVLRTAPDLSAEAEELIRSNLEEMDRRLSEPSLRAAEVAKARQETKEAEASGLPGLYVYALPHYLNYPVDAVTGHTLLKVGRSDRDVIRRFQDQVRTTALPEDPVLLRIYVTRPEDSARQERQFHQLLEAADHSRSAARSGGTEWFMTSLRFLDKVAEVTGLEIRRVFDPESDP
jgi:hypothetical protein